MFCKVEVDKFENVGDKSLKLSDKLRKRGDKTCPSILRRFSTLKLDQKIRQSSAFLTISILVACNKKEETTNQLFFIQMGEVFA